MIVGENIKENEQMVIVKLIKELLAQQNKTIGCFVEESGLPYSTIEKVIIYNKTPKPKDAKIMLMVLGVKLEDVLKLY